MAVKSIPSHKLRQEPKVPDKSYKLPARHPAIADSFTIDTRGDDNLQCPVFYYDVEEQIEPGRLDYGSLKLPDPVHHLTEIPIPTAKDRVERNPRDKVAWLDYLYEHPDDVQAADLALTHLPHSTAILILRMKAAARLYPDPLQLLPIWQQVIEAYSNRFEVWHAFLGWYESCSAFNFEQFIKYHRIFLCCFLDDEHRSEVWAKAVRVFWDAGYLELAIAIIRACWGSIVGSFDQDLKFDFEAEAREPDLCKRWLALERFAEKKFYLPRGSDPVSPDDPTEDYSRSVLSEEVGPFELKGLDRSFILRLAVELDGLCDSFLRQLAGEAPLDDTAFTILVKHVDPKELLKPIRHDLSHPAWQAYAQHLLDIGDQGKARQIFKACSVSERGYQDFARHGLNTIQDWKEYAKFEREHGIISRFRRTFAVCSDERAFPVAIDFELSLPPPFYSSHRIRSLFERAPPDPQLWIRWIQWEDPTEARRLLFRGATLFAASKRFLLRALELVPVSPTEFASLINNAESRGLRIRTMLEEVAPIEDYCKL